MLDRLTIPPEPDVRVVGFDKWAEWFVLQTRIRAARGEYRPLPQNSKSIDGHDLYGNYDPYLNFGSSDCDEGNGL